MFTGKVSTAALLATIAVIFLSDLVLGMHIPTSEGNATVNGTSSESPAAVLVHGK